METAFRVIASGPDGPGKHAVKIRLVSNLFSKALYSISTILVPEKETIFIYIIFGEFEAYIYEPSVHFGRHSLTVSFVYQVTISHTADNAQSSIQ